jgi:YHS domain-containing protein
MKRLTTILALLGAAASALAASSQALAADKPAAKPTRPAAKAKAKLPAKAVCVVCAKKTGKQELEPVHSSLVYKGKTYYFCEDKEKAEFISNPAKYAK